LRVATVVWLQLRQGRADVEEHFESLRCHVEFDPLQLQLHLRTMIWSQTHVVHATHLPLSRRARVFVVLLLCFSSYILARRRTLRRECVGRGAWSSSDEFKLGLGLVPELLESSCWRMVRAMRGVTLAPSERNVST